MSPHGLLGNAGLTITSSLWKDFLSLFSPLVHSSLSFSRTDATFSGSRSGSLRQKYSSGRSPLPSASASALQLPTFSMSARGGAEVRPAPEHRLHLPQKQDVLGVHQAQPALVEADVPLLGTALPAQPQPLLAEQRHHVAPAVLQQVRAALLPLHRLQQPAELQVGDAAVLELRVPGGHGQRREDDPIHLPPPREPPLARRRRRRRLDAELREDAAQRVLHLDPQREVGEAVGVGRRDGVQQPADLPQLDLQPPDGAGALAAHLAVAHVGVHAHLQVLRERQGKALLPPQPQRRARLRQQQVARGAVVCEQRHHGREGRVHVFGPVDAQGHGPLHQVPHRLVAPGVPRPDHHRHVHAGLRAAQLHLDGVAVQGPSRRALRTQSTSAAWRPSARREAATPISSVTEDLVSVLLSRISSTGLTVQQSSPLSSSGASSSARRDTCCCCPAPTWPSGTWRLMRVSGSCTTPPPPSSRHTTPASGGCVWPQPGLRPSEARSWQDRARLRWSSHAARKSSRLWNCSGDGAWRPVKKPEGEAGEASSERLRQRWLLRKGLSPRRHGAASRPKSEPDGGASARRRSAALLSPASTKGFPENRLPVPSPGPAASSDPSSMPLSPSEALLRASGRT
ncbi:hypothetical protein EYF80_042735 [Liparis tanakae]|uniref:Uncharacterized protein n=1 Tax=Liparis tanakae TaxID=230148 RepID=A0A4Z2G1B1_9TELE|nr:hypothetical protein EYF80_042735 [Liparis tanakae]